MHFSLPISLSFIKSRGSTFLSKSGHGTLWSQVPRGNVSSRARSARGTSVHGAPALLLSREKACPLRGKEDSKQSPPQQIVWLRCRLLGSSQCSLCRVKRLMICRRDCPSFMKPWLNFKKNSFCLGEILNNSKINMWAGAEMTQEVVLGLCGHLFCLICNCLFLCYARGSGLAYMHSPSYSDLMDFVIQGKKDDFSSTINSFYILSEIAVTREDQLAGSNNSSWGREACLIRILSRDPLRETLTFLSNTPRSGLVWSSIRGGEKEKEHFFYSTPISKVFHSIGIKWHLKKDQLTRKTKASLTKIWSICSGTLLEEANRTIGTVIKSNWTIINWWMKGERDLRYSLQKAEEIDRGQEESRLNANPSWAGRKPVASGSYYNSLRSVTFDSPR